MFLDNIQSQSDNTLKTAQRLIRLQLAYRKKHAKEIAAENELIFNNPLKKKIP